MRRRVVLLLFTVVVALAGCRTESDGTGAPPADLAVTVPQRIAAGEPVVVTAGPLAVPDETPVTIILDGGYGPQLLSGVFVDGLATVPVPATLTQQAGAVTVRAATPGHAGSAEMWIEAGPPVEPVTPLVGARSIVADGATWSMVVVLPFDQFNNPVADGTPFTVRALHPDETLEQLAGETAHLVGWKRIYSGTEAGRTTIAVEAGGAPGPEGTLLEVPGPPAPFTLRADPSSLPADGRSLATVRTSTLRDRFGNVLLDGTLVTFLVSGDDGTIRRLPAVTIGGSAETTVQAPLKATTLTVRASADGVQSDPLNVAVTDATSRFPVDVTIDVDGGVLLLTAGPLLGNLGQYAPDGTPVTFYTIAADDTVHRTTAVVDNGYATGVVRLAELDGGDYRVEARSGDAGGSAEFALPVRSR